MNVSRLSRNQVGIAVLAAITGFIHLVLLNISMGKVDVLFTLNGLGYFAFLAAMLLPVPILQNNRKLVRWGFIAFTAATIVAWIFMGDKSFPGGILGYITKLVELGLIYFLFREK